MTLDSTPEPAPAPDEAPAPGLAAPTDAASGLPADEPRERPATSDPDAMVDTPDDLGGTAGANAGGAG